MMLREYNIPNCQRMYSIKAIIYIAYVNAELKLQSLFIPKEGKFRKQQPRIDLKFSNTSFIDIKQINHHS